MVTQTAAAQAVSSLTVPLHDGPEMAFSPVERHLQHDRRVHPVTHVQQAPSEYCHVFLSLTSATLAPHMALTLLTYLQTLDTCSHAYERCFHN